MNYSGPYFEPSYVEDHAIADPYSLDVNMNLVVNNTDGSILGYKYFNFDKLSGSDTVDLVLDLIPEDIGGKIEVFTEAPWKGDPKPVGEIELKKMGSHTPCEIGIPLHGMKNLKGKHPIYLKFSSPEAGKSLCSIKYIQFRKPAK